MTYHKVTANIKTKAVLNVMGGRSVSSVSKKYQVSRASLYSWVEIAGAAIEESFNGRPARQRDLIRKLKARIAKKDRLIGKLELELNNKIKEIKRLQSAVKDIKDIARPGKCEKCGCEKVYKNGYYKITLDYFREHLAKIKDKNTKIKIQHFICAACGQSICVMDPLNNTFSLTMGKDEEWKVEAGKKTNNKPQNIE